MKDDVTKVYNSKPSSKLSLDEVFSCISDEDLGLSEDGSIDEVCKSRIDGKDVLSIGRAVPPDLPSGENTSTGDEAMNASEYSCGGERFDSECYSIVWLCSLYVE